MSSNRRQSGALTVNGLIVLVLLASLSAGVVYWRRQATLPEQRYQEGNRALVTEGDAYGARIAWEEAAALGHIGAKAGLAKLYLEGNRVPKNSKLAFDLYTEAALAGNATAQLGLAELYFAGHGVNRSLEESVVWYLAAAGQGEPLARFALGRAFDRGLGVPADAASSAAWYALAAESGHGESQLALGLMYNEGRGVDEDPAQAAVWLERAAEDAGIAEAYSVLGTLFEAGRGVSRDAEQAEYNYQKAGNLSDYEALYRLGRLLYRGRGTTNDPRTAAVHLRLAASSGHRGAQYLYGTMLEAGNGVHKSQSSAKRMYRLAAEQGHIDAIAALAEIGVEESRPSSYQRKKSKREARRRKEREADEQMEMNRRAGVCDIGGVIEMRTRADCLNRGGSFRDSDGKRSQGSFVTLGYEDDWTRKRREARARMPRVPEPGRMAEWRGSASSEFAPASRDWVVCGARQSSDSRGRARYRCSAATAKELHMSTSWCRERGYSERKLFKHESSARDWVSDHCRGR